MKNILDVEDLPALRALVVQDLKEMGIKVPKAKKNKKDGKDDFTDADLADQSVFGNSLQSSSCVYVDQCGYVPRFLVQATRAMENHLKDEGIFRKAGSISRQKELKHKLEDGCELNEASVLDVAALIKQFFRELPESAFSSHLQDTFLKCVSLECPSKQTEAVLLLCLLLPCSHLSTLRFIMVFFARVVSESEHNKMDSYNLAVCLAPSLMWVCRKNEKAKDVAKDFDEKNTQRVMVIQTLISNAADVGMVNESLCRKVVQMGTYFPSDNELEKSCDAHDESKTKKKKRRSGSLQGLMNNISNSFSKWRNKDKSHNSSSLSERSTISIASTSSAGSASSDTLCPTNILLHHTDATPKVMRKRKASMEMHPFSATKKKAILSKMPQMSALGSTPFTPASAAKVRSRAAQFALDSPSIHFTDDSQVEFTASPGRSAKKGEKQYSPLIKSKGHGVTKTGCFSPKTTKRRSVKGFFRRLSGSKDPQPLPSCGLQESPDVAYRLASTKLNTSGTPQHKKKNSLFRRHKRTPSSPARLITPSLTAEELTAMARQAVMTKHGRECISLQVDDVEHEDADVEDEDDEEQSSRRGRNSLNGEGTPGLRRGRPNSVNNGLPPQRYVPSPNRSRQDSENMGCRPHDADSDADDEMGDGMACDEEDMDTSQAQAFSTTIIYAHHAPDCGLPSDSKVIDLSRLDMLEGEPNENYEEALDQSELPMDQSMQGDSLDQGFLGEGLEGVDPLDISGVAYTDSPQNVLDNIDQEKVDADGFKMPMAVKTVESDAESLNKSVISETSDCEAAGGIPKSDSSSSIGSNTSNCSSRSSRQQCVQNSTPVDTAADAEPHLRKSCSYSVTGDRPVPVIDGNRRQSAGPRLLGLANKKPSGQADSSHPLMEYYLAAQERAKLRRERARVKGECDASKLEETLDESAPFLKGAEVRLPSHNSVKELQEKNAGKVLASVQRFDEQPQSSHVAVSPETQEIMERHAEPLRFPSSTLRGRSPVRIPSIFVKNDKDSAKFRDMACASLRMSPVPKGRPNIPINTNLVKSSSVEQAVSRLGHGVEADPTRQGEKVVVDAPGHTPKHLPQKKFVTVENSGPVDPDATPKARRALDCGDVGPNRTPLRDNIDVSKPVLPPGQKGDKPPGMTPRIKAPIIPTNSISKRLLQHQFDVTPMRGNPKRATHRSPIKPVKRLDSPCGRKSPRRRSPMKQAGQRGLSPVPFTGSNDTCV